MFSQESDIVRTMRLIEELKAALISDIGALYRALAGGSGQLRKDLLAAIIVNCYVLGKRLGIDFADMDYAVKDRAEQYASTSNELEKRFGDFSKFVRYIGKKR